MKHHNFTFLLLKNNNKLNTDRTDRSHIITKLMKQCPQKFNPLKRSGIRWLHFEVFNAIQV